MFVRCYAEVPSPKEKMVAQRESEEGGEGSLGAELQAQVGTHSMGEPHLPPRASLWSCPLRRRP